LGNIDLRPYLQTVLKYMSTGQSRKIPHDGCSESNALSISMEVDGFVCYCFKCGGKGFLAHEDSTFRDRKRREKERAAYLLAKESQSFDLPSDATYNLDTAAIAWLGRGGWGNDLIQRYRPQWSESLGRCLFSIEPVGYIARAVFKDQFPKYLAKGPCGGGLYWKSGFINKRVCLTEDILSAGRVGEVYPAMAMLGTDSFNWDIIMKCTEVVIWSDGDAGGDKARMKIHKVLDWVDTRVIDVRTPKDPKAYTKKQIIQHMKEAGVYVA
jgi:hypothetical protein